MRTLSTKLLWVVALGSLSLPLYAADVSVPNQFASGQKAVAAEVNANFQALVSALNDALDRIAIVEAENHTFADKVAALEAENQTLAGKVAAIESNKALELGDYVQVLDGPEVHGYTTVRFSGVNLQVVDGNPENRTVVPGNGLGNLIVGYNEGGGVEMCSAGLSEDDKTTCESNGWVWSDTHKSGTHNLVVGPYHNYAGSAGTVMGYKNGITGTGSTITGGINNLAFALFSSISGGEFNRADGRAGSIVGGLSNHSSYYNHVVVVGGMENRGQSDYAVVVGGEKNLATGFGAVAIGGKTNVARGDNSVVLGGEKQSVLQDEKIGPNPEHRPDQWMLN